MEVAERLKKLFIAPATVLTAFRPLDGQSTRLSPLVKNSPDLDFPCLDFGVVSSPPLHRLSIIHSLDCKLQSDTDPKTGFSNH